MQKVRHVADSIPIHISETEVEEGVCLKFETTSFQHPSSFSETGQSQLPSFDQDSTCFRSRFPLRKQCLPLHRTATFFVRRQDSPRCYIVLEWQLHPQSEYTTSPTIASNSPDKLHASHARRKGVAAEAGWVLCPACARALNRLGFASHVVHVHANLSETEQEGLLKLLDGASPTLPRGSGGMHDNNASLSVHDNETQFASEKKRHEDQERTEHLGLTAAKRGDIQALAKLLDSGWDPLGVLSLDRHGASALDWSAGRGHLEVLQLLLSCGALQGRGSIARRDGKGPLHWAARGNHAAVVRWLLHNHTHMHENTVASTRSISLTNAPRPHFWVSMPTVDGTTPLHLACYGGSLSCVALLVELKADPFGTNRFGCNASHFACMGEAASAVAICQFLQHQCRMRFVEVQSGGHTPLHKAAMAGNAEVVAWLTESQGEGVALDATARSELGRVVASQRPNCRPSAMVRSPSGMASSSPAASAHVESLRRRLIEFEASFDRTICGSGMEY
jgi:ankyrin repeat protein